MPLPPDLDSIDLSILGRIARAPEITTGEIQSTVYLSRTQLLRRLQRLESQGLITRSNSIPGQPYRYTLSPQVTPEEIEQYNEARLSQGRDPIAREALMVVVQVTQSIIDALAEMVTRLETIIR